MDSGPAAFLAISVAVIVTPGQDTALTIRNTLLGGRRGGVATALGVAGGQFVWTVAASVGVTALLAASEPIFLAVRMAGAAYLVYLGLTSLRAALRGVPPAHLVEGQHGTGAPALAPRRALRQGFVSNLGNPKMVVFFSSLLPQFVPAAGPTFLPMLALGLVFCTMTLIWLSGYAWVVARAGNVLRRPRVRRTIDAVTGTVLIAFGFRVAAEPV